MLPMFPRFKNLELQDRTVITTATECYPPYSDFNFSSLWAWNTNEKMMISQLNGNLVVLFYDYVSEQPFLSFIGKNHIAQTAWTLLTYSKQQFQSDTLRLIPEELAIQIPASQFIVTADIDSNDYILSVPYLANLHTLTRSEEPGREIRQFMSGFSNYCVNELSGDGISPDIYLELFARWADNKKQNHLELNEYKAFERYLQNADSSD